MVKARAFRVSDFARLPQMSLRKADQLEVVAATGQSPVAALYNSVLISEWTEIIEEDGKLIGIYGLAKISDLCGAPWFVATDDIYRYKRELLRYAPIVIRDMLKECKALFNFCDVNNRSTIRWLKRLGFKFTESKYILHDEDVEFTAFYRGDKTCVFPLFPQESQQQ